MRRLALVLAIGSCFSMRAAEQQVELKEADLKRRTASSPRHAQQSVDLSGQQNAFIPEVVLNILEREVNKALNELNIAELEALRGRLLKISKPSLEKHNGSWIDDSLFWKRERLLEEINNRIPQLEICQARAIADPVRMAAVFAKYKDAQSLDSMNLQRDIDWRVACFGKHGYVAYSLDQLLDMRGIIQQIAQLEKESDIVTLEFLFKKADHIQNLDDQYMYKFLIKNALKRIQDEKWAADIQRILANTQAVQIERPAIGRQACAEVSVQQPVNKTNSGWLSLVKNWVTSRTIGAASVVVAVVAGLFAWKKYAGASSGARVR